MTDLSIIILNYKTKKLTLDCINSVVKNSKGISLEIIVIDNASNDGSVEALRRSIKRLSSQVGIMAKLIVNKENLGFAKANNHILLVMIQVAEAIQQFLYFYHHRK